MHFPSIQSYKTLFYKFGQGVTRLILHVSLLQPAQECITGMGFMCSHTHSLDKHGSIKFLFFFLNMLLTVRRCFCAESRHGKITRIMAKPLGRTYINLDI